jgi:hypothetical protein
VNFIPQHNLLSFRFRRWSRKGWAVFASLGRLVTIGRLQGDVAQQSLVKLQWPFISENESECPDCREEEEELTDSLLQEIELMTIRVVAPVSAPIQVVCFIVINQAVDADNSRINRFFYR